MITTINEWKKVNESRDRFISQYNDMLKNSLKQLDAIHTVMENEIPDDIKDEFVKKEEKIFNTYDNELENLIYGFKITLSEIIDTCLNVQDLHGTEPQMILYGIEDYYNMLVNLKLIKREV